MRRKKLFFLAMVSLLIFTGCTPGSSKQPETTSQDTGGMYAAPAYLEELRTERSRLEAEILSAEGVTPDGPVYYISPDGDDLSDGLTPETAWKTPEHPVLTGATVLFERGGVWRGGFTAQAGVTYSAYGGGEKPCIYGSPFDGAAAAGWDEVSEGVWRYRERITKDVGGIFFDGGRERAEKVTVNYENPEPVDHVTRNRFDGYRSLTEDLTFWHDLGGRIECAEDEICDGAETDGQGYLYLCSTADPAERFSEIEFLMRKNVIDIVGNNVRIDNLTIRYGGAHGIGSGAVKGLHVTNCVIEYIGGSVQYYQDGRPVRFGNGVEIWGRCEDYMVDHCIIREIYDAGVTHQYSGGDGSCTMRSIRYTNNVITNCTYAVEYFIGPSNSGKTARRYMEDVVIQGNFLGFAGSGFGSGRPDKDTPALIKSWDTLNAVKSASFIIEDNTLMVSTQNLIHICANEASSLPLLRGNVFIQEDGGMLGLYGEIPAPQEKMSEEAAAREAYAGNAFYCIEHK